MNDNKRVATKLANLRTIVSEIRAYSGVLTEHGRTEIDQLDRIAVDYMKRLGYVSSFARNHSIRAKKSQ